MTTDIPNGVLPDHEFRKLIAADAVTASRPFDADQVQPASLDLRLGEKAWRLRASFLPGEKFTVEDRLKNGLLMHELDLRDGAVLEKGCVYLVPLLESLDLPNGISGRANPKSSTGRVDVFTRLITDNCTSFDDVPNAYHGALYLEVVPQTFSVFVKTGCRLNQLRLRGGSASQKTYTRDVTVDLSGDLCGFRARRHAGVVDMTTVGKMNAREFWESIGPLTRGLVLDPGEFYILVSKGDVVIPVSEAAEMLPIDPGVGEFRVHYAGFFDPGFGTEEAGGAGSRGVLEVRSHETPFVIDDGQIVARLVYEPLSSRPTKLYGEQGSHYQSQGLQLSKYFADW